MRYNVLFTTQQNICFGFGIFVNNKQLCMEEEIWKDVVGWEGKYSVSSRGRIKSNARFVDTTRKKTYFVEERIMSLKTKNNGYLEVNFKVNGENNCLMVHRLVAIAFIPNSADDKMLVDHIDGNRKNNNVSNLRWCNHKENSNFELAKINFDRAGVNRMKPVVQFTKNLVFVAEYSSSTEASLKTGLRQGNISTACCSPKKRTCGGYIWKKKEDVFV